MNIVKVSDSYGGTEIVYYCKDSVFNKFGNLTPFDIYVVLLFVLSKINGESRNAFM